MALKDTWKDLEDAVQGIEDSGSDLTVKPINDIAHAVIKNEEDIKDLKKNGGGASITVDDAMSDTSTNPVQNKVAKKYTDKRQYKDAIIIGNATNGATAETCDVLYNDGDNFVDTFNSACEFAAEKGTKTIKLLPGDYLSKDYLPIRDSINLIGDGMPYIYFQKEEQGDDDGGFFLEDAIQIESSNVMVENIKVGKSTGFMSLFNIQGENIKIINIVAEGNIYVDGENIVLTNSKVKSVEIYATANNCIISNNNITDSVEASPENNVIVGNIIASVPQAGGAGADGKSAYEIALDNGFKGTEKEWLASLKGADGETVNTWTGTEPEIYHIGKNIIDLSKIIRNGDGGFNNATGEITDGSEYIYGKYFLKVGEEYTFSKSGETAYLEFYKEDGSFAGGAARIVLAKTDNERQFTANHPYLLIRAFKDASTFKPQLELGDTATEYEPFYASLNENVKIPIIGDGELETESKKLIGAVNENKNRIDRLENIAETDKTLTKEGIAADAKAVGDTFDFTRIAGKNLIDMSKVEQHKLLDKTTLKWTDYPSGGFTLTDYIYLPPGTTVTFMAQRDGDYNVQWFRYVVAYDENNVPLEYAEQTDRYTLPDNAVSIRMAFNMVYSEENGQVMLSIGEYNGTNFPPYEPYNETKISGIKVYAENVIGLETLERDVQKSKYDFRKVDVICDEYSCGKYSEETEKIPYLWHGVGTPVSHVYDLYDALVTDYPDYVTRTQIGTTTATDDTEALPIYCYEFKPTLPIDGGMELCKILYCTGTHGGEVSPIMVGARFFTDLCKNWRTQDLLKTLRFNCHFKVIPLVNPYGFVMNKKHNENGVNLNRNFTNDWKYFENSETGSSGATPASETITQIIEQMVDNEHFTFCLDHHTYANYTSSGKTGYIVGCVKNPVDMSFSDMFGVWANAKAICNNTLITDLTKGYFQMVNRMAEYQGYMYGAFKNGFCIETMTEWGNEDMETLYDSQKFNAETIGAIFHSAFVGYHNY